MTCSRDTDGDGHCGNRWCSECGGPAGEGRRRVTGWWLLVMGEECAVVEAQSEFGARCHAAGAGWPIPDTAEPVPLERLPTPPLRNRRLDRVLASAVVPHVHGRAT